MWKGGKDQKVEMRSQDLAGRRQTRESTTRS